MTIESQSGRELKTLSLYPDEDEVVFRPFTTFYVKQKKVKDGVLEILLKEAHPDVRGRRVLVWVDDSRKKNDERHKISDKGEEKYVTCVHLHSTKEALKFFKKRQQQLLKRGIDQLRIMTDMVRTENGKQNIEAGLELARELKQLSYNQGILCFTGSTYLERNREKFKKAGLPNVYATARGIDAENFAKFNPELPGTLSKYSTVTPSQAPTTDSSSSSSVVSSSSSTDDSSPMDTSST